MSANAAAETTVWLHIGETADFPAEMGKTVRVQGSEIAVFRLASGAIKAIENRCPHKNGVLAEGIVSGEYVFCPMHDRKIDLASGLVQLPDTGCVRTFEVAVRGEQVYVRVNAEG